MKREPGRGNCRLHFSISVSSMSRLALLYLFHLNSESVGFRRNILSITTPFDPKLKYDHNRLDRHSKMIFRNLVSYFFFKKKVLLPRRPTMLWHPCVHDNDGRTIHIPRQTTATQTWAKEWQCMTRYATRCIALVKKNVKGQPLKGFAELKYTKRRKCNV